MWSKQLRKDMKNNIEIIKKDKLDKRIVSGSIKIGKEIFSEFTPEEKNELKDLRIKQNTPTRLFSQQEFERLHHLAKKAFYYC